MKTRTLDFYCEKKCQQINQECCVCYEHSDTKHFVTFKCNHSICVECFKKIKKGWKVRCPLCRCYSTIPSDTKIISKKDITNQPQHFKPWTNKLDFLFVQLNFSPTLQAGVVCNKAQQLLINKFFDNNMVKRIHFLKKKMIYSK